MLTEDTKFQILYSNMIWIIAGLIITLLCGISIWEICFSTSKEVVTDSLQQIAQEVYESVKRSNEQYYADHCINLLRRYPQLINIPITKQRFSPFLRACWIGNLTLVNYMLQNGADISQRTLRGESPLFLAVHTLSKNINLWNPALINLLYKSGCSVNARKEHGFSPLHIAAKTGHVALVGWLLVHGADPECTTICGYKPVDIAREEGHEHIVRLLTIRIGDTSPLETYKAHITRTPNIPAGREKSIKEWQFNSLY